MIEYLGVALLLIGAILWVPYIMRTGKIGAPFVPMEPDVVNRVMEIADVKNGDIFYDLGSGDGRLVVAAALRGAQAYGVEIDTLRVWYSRFWISILRLGKNAKIIQKNIFDVDYSAANVVSLYLLQQTNEKIEEKLKRELKPGTRVVSTAFTFPDWEPADINLNGTIYGPVHLYVR